MSWEHDDELAAELADALGVTKGVAMGAVWCVNWIEDRDGKLRRGLVGGYAQELDSLAFLAERAAADAAALTALVEQVRATNPRARRREMRSSAA